MSRLTKSAFSGSNEKLPLVSTHAASAPYEPISGRVSTVNRATNEPPGTPSPEGSVDCESCGSLVFASPSSRLPTMSVTRSEMVKVKRSSGSGSKNVTVTNPVAITPLTAVSPVNVIDWIGMMPLWSPRSV